MTIGVLGATGYTGRLVAAELRRRGLACRLGGRDPDRLAALPTGDGVEVRPVDVHDPAGLDRFLDGLDAVVSCVGPFTRHGDAVVDAAVERRVPYADSSGEPAFVAGVLDRHADAPVPVVPACGFDGLVGDLVAALAAERLAGPVERLVVAYRVQGGAASRGTIRSAAAGTSIEGVPRPVRAWFPERRRWAVPVPFVDAVLVPRYVPAARVEVVLALPAGLGVLALGLAHPVASRLPGLVDRLTGLLPEGPSPRRRASLRFAVTAEAHGGGRRAGRAVCTGRDTYGTTARSLVEAAVRFTAGDVPLGARPPSAAFPPDAFLDALCGDGVA